MWLEEVWAQLGQSESLWEFGVEMRHHLRVPEVQSSIANRWEVVTHADPVSDNPEVAGVQWKVVVEE